MKKNSTTEDRYEKIKKAREAFYNPKIAKESLSYKSVIALKVATDDCNNQMKGQEEFNRCLNLGKSVSESLNFALKVATKKENIRIVEPFEADGNLANMLSTELNEDLADADKDEAETAEDVKAKTKNHNRFFVWVKDHKKSTFWVVIAVMLIIVLSVFSWKYDNKKDTAKPKNDTTADAKEDAEKEEVSGGTWKMATGNYAENRWFSDGVSEIKDAKTDKEAADAIFAWLDRVKTDPNLLAGVAKFLLHEDIDIATLADADGWATDATVQLTTRLQMLFGSSDFKKIIITGIGGIYNTGVTDDGTIVTNEYPGITGDGTAVQATLPDGTVIWVLARCGNIVTSGKPSIPTGDTDEPQPKKPWQDPAAKGNASTGGGTNVDSGPGTYIAPENMEQPAATTYVAPAAPAPTTTVPSGSTPDTTPAPAAESQAPTPEAPATGEVTVPGF